MTLIASLLRFGHLLSGFAIAIGSLSSGSQSCYFGVPISTNASPVAVSGSQGNDQSVRQRNMKVTPFNKYSGRRFHSEKQERMYYYLPWSKHRCISTETRGSPEARSRRPRTEISIQTCTVFNDLCQTFEDKGFNFAAVINHLLLFCLRP